MYLNLIIGLTYKWYDQEKIDDFFNQLGGKDRELYEGLLWIGLENALYQKERKIRSVMEELRREYALDNRTVTGIIKNIKDRTNPECTLQRNFGTAIRTNYRRGRTFACILLTEEMTTDEILEQTRENLWKYFSYRPSKAAKKKGVYFLQKVAGAFHSVGKVSATYVRAKHYEDKDVAVRKKQEL